MMKAAWLAAGIERTLCSLNPFGAARANPGRRSQTEDRSVCCLGLFKASAQFRQARAVGG